jgi:hypothetical protein
MSDETLYARIAERFSFSLPAEYRRLRERGWLAVNQPPVPVSTEPGDGYLWMNEMEWYPLEEIAEFRFPDYGEPYLPGLVPFAFTAGGDYWCWQARSGVSDNPRVLLCPHECEDGEIYAPNFSAALFRQCLDFANQVPDSGLMEIEEARAHLRRWSRDLAAIFPPGWCAILADLAARPQRDWSDRWRQPRRSLLSAQELQEVETRELAFPEMGTEIRWMALEEE